MNIKLFLTDIDGVWTDGGMYYDDAGGELKKFNTSDSAGVLLLKSVGIPTGIISGENNEVIRRRAKKLGIEIVKTGIRNKLACAISIADEQNMDLSEIAYIGDDLVDMDLLQRAGLSAAPANAASYVKSVAKWVLKKNGGEGAFREFAERYLDQKNLLEKAISIFLENLREG